MAGTTLHRKFNRISIKIQTGLAQSAEEWILHTAGLSQNMPVTWSARETLLFQTVKMTQCPAVRSVLLKNMTQSRDPVHLYFA